MSKMPKLRTLEMEKCCMTQESLIKAVQDIPVTEKLIMLDLSFNPG